MAEQHAGGSEEFDFAHLLDSTRHVGVEDAAVRDVSSAPESETPTPAAPPQISDNTPAHSSEGPTGFCESCGHPRAAVDRFCERCGTRLPDLGTAPPPPIAEPLSAPMTNPPSAPTAPPIATSPPVPPIATNAAPPIATTVAAEPPSTSPSAESVAAVGEPESGSSAFDPSVTRTFHEAPAETPESPVSPTAGLISHVPGVDSASITPDIPNEPVETPTSEPSPTSDQVLPSLIITSAPDVISVPSAPPPIETSVTPPVAPVDSPENVASPSAAAFEALTDIDDDDDTATVSIAALRAARAQAHIDANQPTVQAVLCPDGHPNPPHLEVCRACSLAIADRNVTVVPRPILGKLVFDDGRVELLDAPLVIGRKPSADQTVGSEPARAIALDDPDKLLSRVHAEIRLAEWQVQVIDRESMNHTFVQIPGQSLFQLRPGEAFPIPPGTRVVFAEVTACHFRLDVS